MFDKFNRKINYLRISVTDRCNLRCTYCMPEKGIELLRHQDILSFDEIVEVTRVAVSLGVDKVRITGGEPLVRKGIVTLVRMIAEIEGVDDFGMTTNGILLEKFAPELAQAGLQRINISLDTMNPERYRLITRNGTIEDVLSGVESARKAGLQPIKINCVVQTNSVEPDALEVKKFAESQGFQVRFIPKMKLETGVFGRVENGEGGNCKACNRLRLTANGKIKPCLFCNLEYDVRKLGAEQAIRLAIGEKPESGSVNLVNQFSNIGG
jgi:cyclic pyranopterin phosphate synthase